MFSIKICGLTNLDDALWALEAGADYLGFVLYPRSPRAVTAGTLAQIIDHLPGQARPVGVFVNETPAQVRQIAAACRLAAVQLNGDEGPEGFLDLNLPVWRSVRLESGLWSPAPALWTGARFVMDAASPAYGGTGLKVDWVAGRSFASRHPAILAGGLGPDSVAEAIRQVQPAGVDVSSGVESSPGKKDFRKVSAFIARARAAAGMME